jgi:hypothetical protein
MDGCTCFYPVHRCEVLFAWSSAAVVYDAVKSQMKYRTVHSTHQGPRQALV